MGKVEQHNEGVPEISPQTEASKLLEAALLQMDGIISGNIGSATSNSPDYGFGSPPFSPPGVKDAANVLVSALQSNSAPPAPDPVVARVLMTWIQEGNGAYKVEVGKRPIS
ncbi:hypothetical protein RN001_003098 [Aquatica leii]|uniref:Uncharacterized protein n=1 Tax=Aquatica leii TaxID=1421715 RepID=A0AAN7PHU1_9COLE|nr:hypothetical protein RN001_003098 [Aquatica leii]